MPGADKFTLSGSGTLVAAPTAPAFIRVFSYHVSAASAASVLWKSGSNSLHTDYVGPGGIDTQDMDGGVFDCGPGEALVVDVTGTVSGCGRYAVIGAG